MTTEASTPMTTLSTTFMTTTTPPMTTITDIGTTTLESLTPPTQIKRAVSHLAVTPHNYVTTVSSSAMKGMLIFIYLFSVMMKTLI